MHADRLRKPLERLRRALAPDDGDAQMLARFIADRDEAAFAALVRRHGPMVLGACRRLLGHRQDAEDAFQATFLVLARRAGSVRKREALASWLYGVAYRVALDAAGARARRRRRERQVEDMPHPEVAPAEPQDWRPLLDQELMALPEKYRAAVVLCDLEGRPRREAARLLRLSEGTLSSRLARARSLLAGRLSRRGVALSGAAVAAALAGGAEAAVPARLVLATAKAAALVAAGNVAAVGNPAALLLYEYQRGMLMAKLKVGAALAAVTLLLGVGGLAYQASGQERRGPVKSAEVRAPGEMELLRKEMELLKLQVELLQEKVRAQGIELRELKGRPARGAAPAGLNAAPSPLGTPAPAGTPVAPTSVAPLPATAPPALGPTPPATAAPAGPAPVAPEGALPALAPGTAPPTAPVALPHDPFIRGLAPAAKAPAAPLSEVEAAMKALREARNPESRVRAAERLEKAARRLRGQDVKSPSPAQPGQP